MSHDVPTVPDFDFWEFVCCSRCRMPFGLENGSATVPFWLTECGHIICNNHLSPDRVCCQCGAQDIQLAPLSRQMDAPMSEWFQSIPLSLDAIAYAAKFQQEAMASQIRYHKLRHQQLRQLVERLKQEIAELKRNQLEQRHQHVGMSRTQDNEVSDHLNVNGKREMLYTHQFDQSYRKTRTDSSPRSITTPIGPDRLTLLPGQQLPELSTHKQQEQRKYSHSPVYMRDRQSRGYQNGMSVGQSSNRVPECV
ncbi:hypothetical protein CPC08DRAFT_631306 [Agrocybe pediades]|nr:hypothetical protein CPC08DRAFT_631306 [Agrocybe pediades]